jgi:hypothetical protein
MGLFSDFVAALKRRGQANQWNWPFKSPFPEIAEQYTATTEDLRTDAAMHPGEEFGFLLGEETATRGWIKKAKWDEKTNILKLWTAAHGPYDFPGIDQDGAKVFAAADSKGAWFWGVYMGRAFSGPVTTKAKDKGKVGHATPLFSLVKKRRK